MQPVNNKYNMDLCFANVLKTFTMKHADMSKFVGVVSEKDTENISEISSDIDKIFGKFHKEITKSWSTTVSIYPNKYNIEGEAIISDNPNNSNKQKQEKATISDNRRHSSKANAINREVDDDDNLSSTEDDADIHHLRSKRKITNYENKRKNKRTRQPSYPPENQISLHGGSKLDAEIDKVAHDYSDGDDISDSGEDECIENIASDLSTIKISGQPIKFG